MIRRPDRAHRGSRRRAAAGSPTLDLLASLGERAVWVRRNADRESMPIRPDQRSRLDALPLTVTLDINGFGRTLSCHATPRDDEEVVLVDSRMARWREVQSTVDKEVTTIVCGHTHTSALAGPTPMRWTRSARATAGTTLRRARPARGSA